MKSHFTRSRTLIESPTNSQEVCDLVRSRGKLIPIGASTKPALFACAEPTVSRVDMRSISGIVSYEPTEFLVTARAGTPVEAIEEALASKGQYLPFDPVWKQRGSTIGGAVASGLSGPARILYGSLRDFMLEVVMIDGLGREVRGGAKVVKNAAGFDFPKLMVGSYGRLGIITEVTLKVFPKPPGCLTLVWTLPDLQASVRAMLTLIGLPLQVAAVDIDPPQQLLASLAGPPEALAKMADRADASVGCTAARIEQSETENQLWRNRAELNWLAPGLGLVRVATTAHQAEALVATLRPIESINAIRISCAGAVAWLAVDMSRPLEPLDSALRALGLSAVAISGGVPALTSLGDCRWHDFATRVQQAIDPNGKFVGFHNIDKLSKKDSK